MTIEKLKRGSMCVGGWRFCGIDVGFDLRTAGQSLVLGEDADADRILSDLGVGYDGADGPEIVRGTRDEVARALARAGYTVVAAHTPNGRDVRCEPKNPEVFVCQPPNDNYWREFPDIQAALDQWGQ